MKKSKIVTIIILIIVLLVGGFFLYLGNHKIPINQININSSAPVCFNKPNGEILGNKQDIVSFPITAGCEFGGASSFTGIIKGGYFFEGNIIVNILDINKKLLRVGHGNAKTDWMTAGPVTFDVTVDSIGLPDGFAYIQILKDDPSAGASGLVKEILIPIKIQNSPR